MKYAPNHNVRSSLVAILTFLIVTLSMWYTTANQTFSTNDRHKTTDTKILLTAYEFVDPIFSGNGVYARTIVTNLLRDMIHVTVICARNDSITHNEATQKTRIAIIDALDKEYAEISYTSNKNDIPYNGSDIVEQYLRIVSIPVTNWGTLDRSSSWVELIQSILYQDQGLEELILSQGRHDDESNSAPDINFENWFAFTGYSSNTLDTYCSISYPDNGSDGNNAVKYNKIIMIDWHGAILFSALVKKFPYLAKITPRMLMNFRVFSYSTELHLKESDSAFYRLMEGFSLSLADTVVALSRIDAAHLSVLYREFTYLLTHGTFERSVMISDDTNFRSPDPLAILHATERQIWEDIHHVIKQYLYNDSDKLSSIISTTDQMPTTTFTPPLLYVLFPALRTDLLKAVRAVPKSHSNIQHHSNNVHETSSDAATNGYCPYATDRCLVLCCVRMSPEKHPDRFVELVSRMHTQFTQLGLRPALCASTGSDTEYARGLMQKLLDAFPNALILREFLHVHDLAKLYRQTLINVHPCDADAYGMTVAEAAAFGVPSIVHYDIGKFSSAPAQLRLRPDIIGAYNLSKNFENITNPTMVETFPTVGATEILRPIYNEAIHFNWWKPDPVRFIESIQTLKNLTANWDAAASDQSADDSHRLHSAIKDEVTFAKNAQLKHDMANSAQTRVLQWTQFSYAAALKMILGIPYDE